MNEEGGGNRILFGLVSGIAVLLVGYVVAMPLLVNKVADKVIEKLKSEYTPGPWKPGIDPDKVDPNKLKTSSEIPFPSREQWESAWEKQRGY